MSSFGDEVRKAMDSELIEPPRGQYKTKLDEASAFMGKDGRKWAKIILEITDGELAGQRFQHFMGFQPPGIAEMNGNALAAYGVNWSEVNDLSDLDDQLAAIVRAGTTAEVGVSYKDSYMNINVHGSRVAGVPDIPTGDPTDRMDETQKQTFASAASNFGDDAPFD